MDAAVTVSELVVDRGPRRVLHGLSFAVPPGQVTGLLGPSGSGKTTLMRSIRRSICRWWASTRRSASIDPTEIGRAHV